MWRKCLLLRKDEAGVRVDYTPRDCQAIELWWHGVVPLLCPFSSRSWNPDCSSGSKESTHAAAPPAILPSSPPVSHSLPTR